MPIKKFETIISTCVPLMADNVDTDQIIPARFLKRTSREGFGNYLFYDQRFTNEGQDIKNNIFNNKKFAGQILLSGKNFGCGSSREHAPWAILDYGFRVVIASSFADIFRLNALNNGLLVVEISEKFNKTLFNICLKHPETELNIDLRKQMLGIKGTDNYEHFDIDIYRKECLLKGYDDIDYILSKKNLINTFEKENEL